MSRSRLASIALLATLLSPPTALAQGEPDPELKALGERVQRDGAKVGPDLMKALARRTDPMGRYALLVTLAFHPFVVPALHPFTRIVIAAAVLVVPIAFVPRISSVALVDDTARYRRCCAQQRRHAQDPCHTGDLAFRQ